MKSVLMRFALVGACLVGVPVGARAQGILGGNSGNWNPQVNVPTWNLPQVNTPAWPPPQVSQGMQQFTHHTGHVLGNIGGQIHSGYQNNIRPAFTPPPPTASTFDDPNPAVWGTGTRPVMHPTIVGQPLGTSQPGYTTINGQVVMSRPITINGQGVMSRPPVSVPGNNLYPSTTINGQVLGTSQPGYTIINGQAVMSRPITINGQAVMSTTRPATLINGQYQPTINGQSNTITTQPSPYYGGGTLTTGTINGQSYQKWAPPVTPSGYGIINGQSNTITRQPSPYYGGGTLTTGTINGQSYQKWAPPTTPLNSGTINGQATLRSIPYSSYYKR